MIELLNNRNFVLASVTVSILGLLLGLAHGVAEAPILSAVPKAPETIIASPLMYSQIAHSNEIKLEMWRFLRQLETDHDAMRSSRLNQWKYHRRENLKRSGKLNAALLNELSKKPISSQRKLAFLKD